MSPNPHCPACEVKRLHTEIETGGFHPLAGHGFYQGLGWSSEEAKAAHDAEIDELARKEGSK